MVHITTEEWLASLRKYKGVRFQHQGRTSNGLDCIGLVKTAAQDLGIDSPLIPNNYRRTPAHTLFQEKAGLYLERAPYNRLQEARVGDICIFWIDTPRLPRHVAVYTGFVDNAGHMMIHSTSKRPRMVVEQRADSPYWKTRLLSVWQLPNIRD